MSPRAPGSDSRRVDMITPETGIQEVSVAYKDKVDVHASNDVSIGLENTP